ncbi:type II toxin-antitoxin system Phd/YefM family antitoxin [Sinanaerobacter chloroacetimidivorans]|uniref:Type II toxin-antitoxin system Phd/YefM family antitoxin n=1 Tax=Sinanaerobacter chloroacetimidivorans TaxID=2818044 RepID=A0A8J7W5H7_9FIRM|nr:type II toxin-antitoxin system Phd/YefM family antitoxin [Sinanaerobacter chloroacetimidivorans]MBR0599315.1 type II toxin-antitoxin system Phd/YefM family antitoxin [Sinanaerobacter chloroacetimidivorans]
MSENNVFSKTITATELKKNLGKYLDYVNENNEVVITKNGEKAVRMTPYLSDYDRYYLMQVKEQALDYQYGGKKVSYEEFMDISEKSELRMEYIDGEIILLGSPTVEHQEISGFLHIIFSQFLKGKKCKVFYAPFDVHFFKPEIKDPDVCQPDLLIACDIEENVNAKGRYMGTPTLVVEILSPSTRSKDMVKKLNTYMLSGVEEFWVVDPIQKTIMIYDFQDLQIESCAIYKNDEVAVSQAFDGLAAPLAEVFV